MKVLKFGGSSIATPERIKSVLNIIKSYLPSEVALVFSAYGGVTDQLIHVSRLALSGDVEYKTILQQLEDRHLDVVRILLRIEKQSSVLAHVKIRFNELAEILHGVFLVKERTHRTLDYIMSFGERLSAYTISEACIDHGIAAEYLDARTVIHTNNQFGNALVDFTTTNKHIKEYFQQHPSIQIITGFIATSETGETTTLGRSGSDYTAAIIAGALRATDLEIWTDVDGMMTADPRIVKEAFTVPEMSYEEAMELSHFGAKVIFPSTMRPVLSHNIPIWIKNTFHPEVRGTRISNLSTNEKLIKGISSISNISLLNIQGSGMVGVVGVSMRLFASLAHEKINVILISQASSEHSICIAVGSEYAAQAKRALEKEFENEMRNKVIDDIVVTENLSIVAVVGDGMKHRSGSSGRMFSALGKNGINVVAIAQGSSERNISAVIEQVDVAKALNVLHEAFFLSDRKTTNLFLIGVGLIGSTLIKQLLDQQSKLLRENHLAFKLIGVANSRKMLFNARGFVFNSVMSELEMSDEAMDLPVFLEKMMRLNLPNSVFIDCTSSEVISNKYPSILAANISIVTPNKKANSGAYSEYLHLRETAFKKGVRFLYETNVGAGLPVINTLNDLVLSGDAVLKIEAVLSGTLNFIFSSFNGKQAFSEIVTEAKAKGYTEPDPRDDLSGVDVARKILILAREAGHTLELSDISVQNLVPDECRNAKSVDDFFTQLKSHDAYWENLRKSAEEKNQKLRYCALLENGKARVALAAVDRDHPFYQLAGSDNILLLSTERYHDRPMVIRGPGAGAAVTAAGVFADIIRIANAVR